MPCTNRLTLNVFLPLGMPAKKKPLPLHVSRALILREQANVVLRTQRRIAILRATEDSQHNDNYDMPVPVPASRHLPFFGSKKHLFFPIQKKPRVGIGQQLNKWQKIISCCILKICMM